MSKNKWKLTDEQYEFIKGEVSHIFEQHKIKCIPVCGFEIASKMNVTLIPYSSLSKKKRLTAMETSEDGFFLAIEDHEYIFYNDINRSYERQNWTLLHEIGHIVLDHTGFEELTDLEEDEANFFAKYAIAPPVLVHKIGAESPNDIYDIFDITYEASIYAYSYYLSWKKRYLKTGILADYEKRMLELI